MHEWATMTAAKMSVLVVLMRIRVLMLEYVHADSIGINYRLTDGSARFMFATCGGGTRHCWLVTVVGHSERCFLFACPCFPSSSKTQEKQPNCQKTRAVLGNSGFTMRQLATRVFGGSAAAQSNWPQPCHEGAVVGPLGASG